MILNNYYNFAGNLNKYSMTVVSDSNASADMGVVDTSGTSFNPQYQGNNYTYSAQMAEQARPFRGLGVLLGVGTTPATANDYSLEDDITSDISSLDVDVNVAGTNGQTKVVITVSGVNASGASISISEIGVYKDIYTDWSQDTSSRCLFIRHNLNNPVSVADGGSFSLTFEWVQS